LGGCFLRQKKTILTNLIRFRKITATADSCEVFVAILTAATNREQVIYLVSFSLADVTRPIIPNQYVRSNLSVERVVSTLWSWH